VTDDCTTGDAPESTAVAAAAVSGPAAGSKPIASDGRMTSLTGVTSVAASAAVGVCSSEPRGSTPDTPGFANGSPMVPPSFTTGSDGV
jgi:hypothetical protein